ncbi:hypothetical protein BDL97_01G158900 [Sphagnum fallax]|nr:hypothetical protein BDL97_01G158900 [Sphagnum fallax]KAH8975463.1 hypothetical protein BDL97_01G158900 [Sphagnum fallax]
MPWSAADMDRFLVPLGMAILTSYHLHLWYRVRHHPEKTIVGVNHLNRRVWVQNIMTDGAKNGILAVQTFRNSIMASTLLASTSITLSSIIGGLVSNTSAGLKKPLANFVYGDKGSTIVILKYLCLLLCFLVAFFCFVQAIRYTSHASFLISIPMGENTPGLTPDYVNQLVFKSTNFFSIGLRAFYFSFPLFLWLFGPIPMFVCSIVMVIVLNILDRANNFKLTFQIETSHEHDRLTELANIICGK